ncbi:MAG: hypothetical protein RLZZ324_1013 [Candidatus Parcubacteria bacterium]|jgi:hypothetical protein
MTETERPAEEIRHSKFALFVLFLLYASQGLPYGFQRMALPILLRKQGVSLAAIGFLGVMNFFWVLKALIAPLADRYYFPRIGRRRSWIYPMQVSFIAAIGMAAAVHEGNIAGLLIAVLFMNLCASTQDIAVDGFAIDILKPHALGLGNTVQVVGYKVGMVLAGGVLLSMSTTHGDGFLFGGMALVAFLPLLFLPRMKEKPVPPDTTGIAGATERPSLKEIVRKAWHLVTGRGMGWAVLLIMTGKLGEELAGTMFTTYLLDHGITVGQIGIWVGSYGMAASITGSALGRLLIARWRPWTVLGLAMALRISPIGMQCWIAHTGTLTAGSVITMTILEHVTGGMVTTAIFTYMMSLVDKRVGATEYTLLSSLEVIGKSTAVFSGVLAQRYGYEALFFTGLLVATFPLYPWWKSRGIAHT